MLIPSAIANGPRALILYAQDTDKHAILQRTYDGRCWTPWVDTCIAAGTPLGVAYAPRFSTDYAGATIGLPAEDQPVTVWARRSGRWVPIYITNGVLSGYPSCSVIDDGQGTTCAYLFGRNTGGQLFWSSLTPEYNYSGWFELGAGLSQSPAAVGWLVKDPRGNYGRLFAVAVTGDGGVVVRDYYSALSPARGTIGWGDWGPLATRLAGSAPAIAYRSPDNFDIFVADLAGGLAQRSYRSGWSADWSKIGGGSVLSRPTACYRNDGRLDVFFWGAGQLRWGAYNGTAWTWLDEQQWPRC
jgi:hypothetical protein